MSAKDDSHAYSNLTECDTNNATYIGWKKWGDGYWPSGYRPENKHLYYKHLDRLNSGRQNGRVRQNKSYNTYEMNRNLIQCMSDKLRLASWEVKKAVQIFDGLQRSSMGLSSELVALSTCAYLIHQYDNSRKCHPRTDAEERDYFVEKCRKEFDISYERFESVYGKVSHKIRNDKLNTQSYDKYEIDSNAEQRWRTRNECSDGWL